MPMSSNCIIHFTQTKESLLGILSENFKLHYCTETFALKEHEVEAKVPMVSFCDIPLSQVKDHIGKYGHYGIGLTKEWAVASGLNPVLYIEEKSHVSESLGIAFDKFIASSKRYRKTDPHKALEDIIRYVKNYQGNLRRKGVDLGTYRFSDEREWRYVPHFSENCEMICGIEAYETRKAEIEAGIDDLRLTFEPNDIKYVIIRDDSEITEFVDHLRRAKGKKYTYQDVERLTTRLLTSDQILGDI